MIETLYLGLRTAEGVDMAGFEKAFGSSFLSLFEPVLTDPAWKRLLQVDGNRCAPTAEGMVFHESLCRALIDCF
jgi:coproporphyrinogen III oxidase-like Fe-S oxidoreductase